MRGATRKTRRRLAAATWLAVVVVATILASSGGELANLTVAVIANEFFDPTIGRIGGFGMNAKMIGEYFSKRPELGVRVVYVFANRKETPTTEQRVLKQVHGWPLISAWTRPDPNATDLMTKWATRWMTEAGVNVCVTIDYRQSYKPAIQALPRRVPCILWAQDPRTRAQVAKVKAIRDPARPDDQPPGLRSADATGIVQVLQAQGRGLATAVPWMPLRDRVPEAYGHSFEGHAIFELPNVMDTDKLCPPPPWTAHRSKEPSVLFLARLDPYKRPWVMLALAREYPHVTFHVAGKPHFDFTNFTDMPTNVVHYKHADGALKAKLLVSCWFLVSTSIHEGLAISYLEALVCGQPILAMVDLGGLVTRYGVYVGEYPGTGMAGLPALSAGFEKLLHDRRRRETLAMAGRQHVVETHNGIRFGRVFADMVRYLGVETTYEINVRRNLTH